MRIPEVSRRYASALYEIAVAKNSQVQFLDQLREIRKAVESDKDLRAFLESPVVQPADKKNLFAGALKGKASEEIVSLISLLADKNRLGILDTVVEAYQESIDDAHGVTRGEVRSASPLTAETQKKIEDIIGKVTNKKVILTFKHDPTLIGGLLAQVGGWTFDDTLNSHLKRLGEDLNRRAN